jgi:phosphoserine phosphatase RsbU/P
VNAILSPAWPGAPELVIDPQQESLRIDELRSLKLLDSAPEHRFDRITRLAAEFFRVPVAYVAFLDDHRQWLKSHVGFCHTETSRDLTFCQYTIHRNEPLVIPDARIHPIGRNHPAVVGEPHLRFYAGVPVSGPNGRKIGTFCLVDMKPREFGEADVTSLIAFANLVEREVNLGEIIQSQNELLKTRHELVAAQKKLTQEFSEAAKYVMQMLPPPFSDEQILLDWQFHPSTHLGGDGLGYRRIDEDRVAFYMLDVTGHGLGSALLAVTALELLRNRNPASQIDFGRPSMVIERLNRSFQMKDHAGKFFSAWYGVYSRSARTLTYSNAGHPPALLLTKENGATQLQKTEPGTSVLGITPIIHIPETTIPFPFTSELYLFTDGLYELIDGNGRGSYDEFLLWLQAEVSAGKPAWKSILHWLDRGHTQKLIDDDVSLLRFATKA